jgi:hypothetical protein
LRLVFFYHPQRIATTINPSLLPIPPSRSRRIALSRIKLRHRFARYALASSLLHLQVTIQSLLKYLEIVHFILGCFVMTEYFFEDADKASFVQEKNVF